MSIAGIPACVQVVQASSENSDRALGLITVGPHTPVTLLGPNDVPPGKAEMPTGRSEQAGQVTIRLPCSLAGLPGHARNRNYQFCHN